MTVIRRNKDFYEDKCNWHNVCINCSNGCDRITELDCNDLELKFFALSEREKKNIQNENLRRFIEAAEKSRLYKINEDDYGYTLIDKQGEILSFQKRRI